MDGLSGEVHFLISIQSLYGSFMLEAWELPAFASNAKIREENVVRCKMHDATCRSGQLLLQVGEQQVDITRVRCRKESIVDLDQIRNCDRGIDDPSLATSAPSPFANCNYNYKAASPLMEPTLLRTMHAREGTVYSDTCKEIHRQCLPSKAIPCRLHLAFSYV